MNAGGGAAPRLEQFFRGRLHAYGLFRDRFGRPRQRFEMAVDAALDQNCLTLAERIRYDHGQTEERTWRITSLEDGGYRATADGVLGQARAVVDGAFLRWRYTFGIVIGGRTLHVRVDDWMSQPNERILISCAVVSKLRVRIGDMTITFVKDAKLDHPA